MTSMPMQTTTQTTNTNITATETVEEIIKNLLSLLNKKEKHIIERRFALDGNAERDTLEKIGGYFGITRERVRQIENNAIHKLQRHGLQTHLRTINLLGQEILRRHGGLLEENKLLSQILRVIQNTFPNTNTNCIRLALSINEEITKEFNKIIFRPHWKLLSVSHELVGSISDKAVKTLTKHKIVMGMSDLALKIQEKFEKEQKPEPALIQSILEIDKRIKFLNEAVGLTEWRNINPKTLRDKITFVLEKTKSSLHFMEVANKIIEMRFDQKKVNNQAVHNELIRNKEFVLIGRGIYALRSWGYEEGTVREVIANVFKNSKNTIMHQDQIIDAVLKQRKVKKITIILNLKNKPQFERVGREAYKLAEAR